MGRGRSGLAGLMLVLLWLGACGGSATPPASAPEPSAEEDDYEAPPIEVPQDCPPSSSDLELWTHAARWADSKGRPYEMEGACLTAPADEAISVTLTNLKVKGVLNLIHNFSIYSDSAALDRLFYEDAVPVGKQRTFEVPALVAGTYLFRCDLHANQMKGVLVVE